jgi:hypothetical protein
MKTIRELRNILKFHPQEINSSVKFFAEHRLNGKVDFNVYLPTRGFNLQRALVWDLFQKRELIWSILMKRHIPRMAILYTVNNVYQVVDGKQRLTAMLDFYDNKFQLEILDGLYYFKDLPVDYQNVIGGFFFAYNVVNEDFDNKIADSEKIEWFKFINFAGTPQDVAHIKKLSEK